MITKVSSLAAALAAPWLLVACGGMNPSGTSPSDGPGNPPGPAAYPLKVSANKHYLVDASGAPFLVAGDAPQCLTAHLSTAEMEAYFAQRAQQGFNAAWVNVLCTSYTGGTANAATYDGIVPFTGTLGRGEHDLTRPNSAFFQRVDAAVAAAARHGIVLFFDPIETGGFLSTLRANGLAAARSYGRYLGQRYLSSDNIVWMHGNDFQSWRSAADDALVRAVALGIKEVDARHLQTVELDYPTSGSLDDAANWLSGSDPVLGIDLAYTYFPTYAQVLKEYNRPSFLPIVMIEGNYELENNLSGPHDTNPHDCRTQYYWSNLSGASGSFYGNKYVWPLAADWPAHMNDPGGLQIAYVQALFRPRAWPRLVPDQDHTVVVSGLGTYSETGNAQDNSYATTARTDDGTLAMTYMPTPRVIGVNMARLAGPATARWFDPTTGTFTSINGSPFPNSGTRSFTPPAMVHSDGYADWVLVLETSAPP